MAIIRDDELGGIGMIPLFCDWHVRRCNVRGCTAMPTTIVTQLADNVPIAGFCEEHFQLANQPDGGVNYTLVFDNFDAFRFAREKKAQNGNDTSNVV